MRAVVVAGPRRLAVEQAPDPTPEPGQLVLRVSACGICGSDLHVHQAGLLPTGAIMGHEFCGEVVEGAGSLRSGELVCALPVLSCGRCARCLSGLGAYCSAQRALGFGQLPGAYAEYVAVAEHCGAGELIVSERAAGRRTLAERLGATRVVDPEREDLAAVLARSAPEGADVVFEAVGAPGLIQQCLERVRFRGRVVVAGVCIEPDTFQPGPAVLEEAALHFVLAYEKRDFERTLELLDQGRVEPAALVTDRIGLDAVPAAFAALERPTDQCKVLVLPGS
jgi:(R,R)-butanediol dehydrogenase/meso-butanediol dehydrogenase/diacetyl reductase